MLFSTILYYEINRFPGSNFKWKLRKFWGETLQCNFLLHILQLCLSWIIYPILPILSYPILLCLENAINLFLFQKMR